LPRLEAEIQMCMLLHSLVDAVDLTTQAQRLMHS
jgi:hypothetical protein